MKKLPIAVAMASCLMFSNAMAHEENNYRTYHVTITNTTLNHVITPPVVIAHNKHFKLFKITQPASDELATMAETGNNGPLLDALEYAEGVFATANSLDQTPPVVLPGQSITITIEAPKKSYFTIAGMLATSNDAFMATTLKGPKKYRYSNSMAMTYDAGSEENSELCSELPGPPCLKESGNGGTATVDGFVTIHNGIHGVGNLIPEDLDWRGPTAMIRIHNGG